MVLAVGMLESSFFFELWCEDGRVPAYAGSSYFAVAALYKQTEDVLAYPG